MSSALHNSQLNISNADFETYKASLRDYLRSQDRFKDYDFAGSNLSVLLDVLAYNTFQNVFYQNMSINEMFLDSAVLRNSVLSHAKSLNYTPRSKISAVAKISFRIEVPDFVPFVIIPARTGFTSQAGGVNYTFYNHEAITVQRVNGIYDTGCIDIFEGSYVTEKFFASGEPDQRLQILNPDVDSRSIQVWVTGPDNIRTEYIYTAATFGVGSEDKVFYVQNTDGKYEVVFGQGTFGAQPIKDSVVEVSYRKTKGFDGNGISNFSFSGSVSGYQISRITVVSPASGGSEAESIDSIRFNAPRALQVQDRAVTESDYQILLRNTFPEISDVAVVGGEKLSPPQYGKVALFVDTVNASGMSSNVETRIRTFLTPKIPLGITPIFLRPEFLYFDIDTVVTYDASKTTASYGEIRDAVKEAVTKYRREYLDRFNTNFRFSKFSTYIDNIGTFEVISTQSVVKPYFEKDPVLGGARNTYSINFENELIPTTDYAFRTSGFVDYKVTDFSGERSDRLPSVYSSEYILNGIPVYFRDNGFGIIQVVRNDDKSDIVISSNIGTVDYVSGKITISNLVLDSYSGGNFRIYVTPKTLDVITPKGALPSIKEEDILVRVSSNKETR